MDRADDYDDIGPLLDDLQETLSTLRDELDETGGRGRPPRRPPSPGEFLRFTEEYTIPTLVSLLESTIRSLELLGGVIRLLDPERGPAAPAVPSGHERVTRGASAALSELRRALAEVDLPPEGEAREVVADARRLSAELDERVRDAERAGRASTRGERAVNIDVRERTDGTEEADETGDGGSGEAGVDREDAGSVDVESELASIREEVRTRGEDEEEGESDGGA